MTILNISRMEPDYVKQYGLYKIASTLLTSFFAIALFRWLNTPLPGFGFFLSMGLGILAGIVGGVISLAFYNNFMGMAKKFYVIDRPEMAAPDFINWEKLFGGEYAWVPYCGLGIGFLNLLAEEGVRNSLWSMIFIIFALGTSVISRYLMLLWPKREKPTP